jgi:hypothetical protein
VREDFFAGFAGDAEALARGMTKCEEVLAKDAKNAEALVWHGAGLSYSAKREFMSGNARKGRQVQTQGVGEMNEAAALRPDDAAVLIPRASVFLSAGLHVPSPEVAKKDFETAANDYEKTLRPQTAEFRKLPVHARGELLGGLAEAWNGLGETEKSRVYLKRMPDELPETEYARFAKGVLAAPAKSGAGHNASGLPHRQHAVGLKVKGRSAESLLSAQNHPYAFAVLGATSLPRCRLREGAWLDRQARASR